MLFLMGAGLALMFWGVSMSDEDVGFGTQMIGALISLIGLVLL